MHFFLFSVPPSHFQNRVYAPAVNYIPCHSNKLDYSVRFDGLACFTLRQCYITEACERSRLTFGGFFALVCQCQQNPIREWSCYVDLWMVTEGIEKNSLGRFNDGADWRQLFFWLSRLYVEPRPPVCQLFHSHSISAAWPCISCALWGKNHGNVDACTCNWYQAAFSLPSVLPPPPQLKSGS